MTKNDEERVLVLRTCDEKLQSHKGFQWPDTGHVAAPDWDPAPECGHGLHGLLEGEGNWDLLDWAGTAKALIVSVARASIVPLGGKVKFPAGEVLEVLPLASAICRLVCDGAKIAAMVQGAATKKGKKSSQLAASGDYSRLAASGYYSQLAASGYYSQLAASGNSSQLAASGNSSQLAASGNSSRLAASGYSSRLAASGDSSRLAASGDYSQLAASGYYSQLAASGDYSQLAASGDSSRLAASGDYSQLAASGNSSQLAASGDYSQLAASGKSSIVMAAAHGCAASAGENGTIALSRWVESEKRYRVSVAYVGEEGIKPNTPYRLDDGGNFVEVKNAD